MRIFIYVRRTTNWSTMTMAQLDPVITNRNKLTEAIDLWNRVFSLPYFEYRVQLKEIAVESWNTVTSDFIVFDGNATNTHTLIMNMDDDDVIVPTDDDDWFSPSLAKYLKACPADFMFWHNIVHQTTEHPKIMLWHLFEERLGSNNYAVRARALKKLDETLSYNLLHGHSKSGKIAEKAGMRQLEIVEPLSCYNRHPGSAHILKSRRTQPELNTLFPDDLTLKIAPRFQWIKPYSERLCNLQMSVKGSAPKLKML